MSGTGKTVQLQFAIPAEIFELMAPKVNQAIGAHH
jgi:hypothetical protein